MKSKIELFSCGLYSSWCYWSEDRTLFDCGEGCALHFRNRVYAADRIVISHKHGDHTLGLPSFIGIRNSARGDKEKPLDIYYPAEQDFSDIKDFVKRRNQKLKFELNWKPIKNGDHIDLPNGRAIRAFSVDHCEGSLGYSIIEKRKRLKGKYVGLNISKLVRDGQIDKNKINEIYLKKLFCYTLDSFRVNYKDIDDAEIWVADATFLSRQDREQNTHMTYDEVCRLASKCHIGDTYASHVSPRYTKDDIGKVKKYPNIHIVSNYHVHKIRYH